MEIGTNPDSWGRTSVDRAAGEVSARLDWQGLRARFLAGYAMRGQPADARAAPPVGGSFHSAAARIIAGYATVHDHSLASVNPSALADGNAPAGKNQPVAGNKRPAIEE